MRTSRHLVESDGERDTAEPLESSHRVTSLPPVWAVSHVAESRFPVLQQGGLLWWPVVSTLPQLRPGGIPPLESGAKLEVLVQ